MTHDQKRARLETLLRENDLSLARVSVAIGRNNKTYLQQYLRRWMPAVLAFQDTETLGRLLGCDPSVWIPGQADHSFRFKPITDSGRTRSAIPVPSRSLFGDDRNRSGRPV